MGGDPGRPLDAGFCLALIVVLLVVEEGQTQDRQVVLVEVAVEAVGVASGERGLQTRDGSGVGAVEHGHAHGVGTELSVWHFRFEHAGGG